MSGNSQLRQLRVPFSGEKISTDPHFFENEASRFVNVQIHRGLYRYLSNQDFVEDLVDWMDIDMDGFTLMIRLGHFTFSDVQVEIQARCARYCANDLEWPQLWLRSWI